MAPQQLSEATDPVENTLVNVSFSDVGQVATQRVVEEKLRWQPLPAQTPIEMLKRPRLITQGLWNTTQTGPILTMDIWKTLLLDPYYADVLTQFRFVRAGVEVSLRINGGQMYGGALMMTLFPGSLLQNCNYLQQRAVLNPGIVSAASQDTIVMSLPWCPPNYWGRTTEDPRYDNAVRLTVDVLSPLRANSETAPTSISYTIMARFIDPEVTWNVQRQSNPAKDATTYTGPAAPTSLGSIVEMAMGMGEQLLTPERLASLAKVALTVLDKPETVSPTETVRQTISNDINMVDRPENSTPLAFRSDSYLGKHSSLMPGGRDWTTSQYAQVPGLEGTYSLFEGLGDFDLGVDSHTPLFHILRQHRYYKGGIKFRLQFFCSAFISARYVLRLIPSGAYAISDWENEITKMIDVKGDTVVDFTIPYVAPTVWSLTNSFPFVIRLESITRIITNNVAVDPGIGLVVWVAGAEDIQFAVPQKRAVADQGWLSPIDPDLARAATESKTEDVNAEKQSFPGKDFSQPFEPIVAGSSYLIDDHLCMSESTGLITDILKKHVPYTQALYNANLNTYRVMLDPTWSYTNFYRCFNFARGGGRVTLFGNANTFQSGRWIRSFDAHLGLAMADRNNVVSASLPHYAMVPYYSHSHSKPSDVWGITTYAVEGVFERSFFGVRDDFEVAFPVLPGPQVPI